MSALKISLEQEHARLLAAKQQEADQANFSIKLKQKEADDEKEERRRDVHALNTKNEEKDKQINIHLQENVKLKADAEKQKAMMSQMEISIRQQLTGQFEIQLKAQKDAVAKLQNEINELNVKYQTEIQSLTVKLSAITALEAQIAGLKNDAASKEKQYNLTI